ncbi:MAG: DUF4399 domain-containing protein [Bacteroidetes bacterium]|nr:DUF4399 domain-containing protein [Bacteroidota bacterium]MDA0899351.1 DUF4399 domain-containing protein [Bacteroidota bacterium]
MKKTLLLSALGAIAFSCSQPTEAPAENHEGHDHDHNHESMAPEDVDDPIGRVFFANLENGDTVSNPVYVEFGVEGMEVRPAGEIVEGTGHHHLLIGNAFLSKGEVIPADENNIHYGGGQTSDTVTLPMGEVRLGMQFANGVHASYGRDMSASIKVFVK